MCLFVILLNWNRCDDTLACIDSLQKQSFTGAQLVVVDQGSTDQSITKIKDAFPDVLCLENGANLGFARGINVGIQWALDQGADWILLLNNDTIVDPQLLDKLMAQRQKDAAVLSPAIFYLEPPDQIWSTGGQLHPLLLEMTGNHGRDEKLPLEPVE